MPLLSSAGSTAVSKGNNWNWCLINEILIPCDNKLFSGAHSSLECIATIINQLLLDVLHQTPADDRKSLILLRNICFKALLIQKTAASSFACICSLADLDLSDLAALSTYDPSLATVAAFWKLQLTKNRSVGQERLSGLAVTRCCHVMTSLTILSNQFFHS